MCWQCIKGNIRYKLCSQLWAFLQLEGKVIRYGVGKVSSAFCTLLLFCLVNCYCSSQKQESQRLVNQSRICYGKVSAKLWPTKKWPQSNSYMSVAEANWVQKKIIIYIRDLYGVHFILRKNQTQVHFMWRDCPSGVKSSALLNAHLLNLCLNNLTHICSWLVCSKLWKVNKELK